MNRFAILAVSAVWISLAFAAKDDSIGNVGDVKLKGYLGERLDAMIERHVAGTDVDYITACFQEKTETKGWWQTELWGKYMHSAVPYLAYCGSERLRVCIDRGVDRRPALLTPVVNFAIMSFLRSGRAGSVDANSGRLATGRGTRARPSLSPSSGSIAGRVTGSTSISPLTSSKA